MNVVSLFAGCGGSSEGWKAAGAVVPVAVENDPHAARTYRHNAPDTFVIERDIKEVSGDDIREAAGLDELDVLDGSPPCQSWSTAGRRGLGADPRGRLFHEYVRLVGELRPRAFVAENVQGMTVRPARPDLDRIVSDLRSFGYSVHARVLRAHWLGVPQTRHRLIILGFRNDLGLDARAWYPDRLPAPTTIGEALPHVARIVRIGRPLTANPEWQAEESWPSSLPGPTLTANGLGNSHVRSVYVETHDGEFRPPTFEELLAYSGFRPNFCIDGSLEKQWERLGNSVPPPMMGAVAERVVAALSR